jgi:hypothetical protein
MNFGKMRKLGKIKGYLIMVILGAQGYTELRHRDALRI